MLESVLRGIIPVLIGFASGVVISGAVFAFLTVLKLVPRLAQKTGTEEYVKVYEEALIAGGIAAALFGMFNVRLPIGHVGVVIVSVMIGIFFGCVAVSLAEVLNALPILTRRLRLQRGLYFMLLSIGIGKMTGSLLYFLIHGFYEV